MGITAEGDRVLICQKDHAHPREVSVQNDPWLRKQQSACRRIRKACNLDPMRGYGFMGSRPIPAELHNAYAALHKNDAHKHVCRK